MLESQKDFYEECGRIVFTAHYLSTRGRCCGSGCRNCPYTPRHVKGATVIKGRLNEENQEEGKEKGLDDV